MLGATMALIYMRDKTMTKQACDVGSHGGSFQVAPEYWKIRLDVDQPIDDWDLYL